jgi:hypothetical protein
MKTMFIEALIVEKVGHVLEKNYKKWEIKNLNMKMNK